MSVSERPSRSANCPADAVARVVDEDARPSSPSASTRAGQRGDRLGVDQVAGQRLGAHAVGLAAARRPAPPAGRRGARRGRRRARAPASSRARSTPIPDEAPVTSAAVDGDGCGQGHGERPYPAASSRRYLTMNRRGQSPWVWVFSRATLLAVVRTAQRLGVADDVVVGDAVLRLQPAREPQRGAQHLDVAEHPGLAEADVLDPDRRPVQPDRVAADPLQRDELVDGAVRVDDEVRAGARQLVQLDVGDVGREGVEGRARTTCSRSCARR